MLFEKHPELATYKPREMLDLAEELIDEALAGDCDRALRGELVRRLAEYRADPTNVRTWPQVRAKLRARKWRGFSADHFAASGSPSVDERVAELRGRP